MRKPSLNKKNFSDQIFLVMTGFNCNNNCVMCSVRPKGMRYKPRGSIEILKDLKEGKKLGYERAEFTGGEPTLRKDISRLVKYAKNLGYKEIALSTNGRMLSSPVFLKNLKKLGLNRVTITLYSHNSNIHNGITRVPDSFNQTISGIKNALSLGIITSVNIVVFSKTIKDLQKTGNFIASLGVKYWTLLDLIPDGYAVVNYKSLSVQPKLLREALNSLSFVVGKFESVNFFDFPFCLFSKKLLRTPRTNVIAAKGRAESINQVGYNPKRFKEKQKIYYDIHKTRNPKCLECAYNKECGGIWNPYKNLYDDAFLKPFKSKIIKS